MAFMFENLDVYQKSVDFADQVTSLTGGFPRGYYFLTDQLNRASLPISANIAEGNGRFTKADRKHYHDGPAGQVGAADRRDAYAIYRRIFSHAEHFLSSFVHVGRVSQARRVRRAA